MTSFTKELLSASVDGKQVSVTATGTGSPTEVHAALSGTNTKDEVYLYAYNANASEIVLTVLWGGTNAADEIKVPVPSRQGRLMIADGKLIQNGQHVTAYTSTGTTPGTIDGFVNRITST